ncbi:Proteasome subunit YC7alpha/Y8 (protease yscE subunit 7) [Dionaea muscipula]
MSLRSGLSAQLYSPDNHKFMYMTGQSYDPSYFLGSPSEDLMHPSSSDDHFHSEGTSEYHLEIEQPDSSHYLLDSYQTNYEAEYSATTSPETVECDDNMVKLKLQELEHALLDDDDDDDAILLSLDHCMDFDGDWTGPDRSPLEHDSPKESSSSGSILSCTRSNKESTSPIPSVSPFRTPRQLLFDCATTISEGNLEQAAAMINDLRKIVSIQGDPSQRIAAYMVEGLAARLAASGKFLYKALKCKEPPATDRLAAMQILFEVCPCFKFGFMAANGAIMEAIKNEKKVHIIDFDINQGNQYITLIQSLAKQRGRLTRVRLTGVDDPESVQRTVGGLKIIGQRLEKLAEVLGVPFTFHAVPSRVSAITPELLECRAGEEALIVNFAFQLHHMPDESVSTINERDRLLQMVKGLNPKLVTMVEQDVNTNTTPFLPRFAEAYSYYSAVFDSLDATLPRESQDRVNVEKQCLARDIVNIVACEGEERIERYEVAGKWRVRMLMAGFSCYPMSEDVSNEIRQLIREYCDRYKLKEEMGALHLGWEQKNLIVASAWR